MKKVALHKGKGREAPEVVAKQSTSTQQRTTETFDAKEERDAEEVGREKEGDSVDPMSVVLEDVSASAPGTSPGLGGHMLQAAGHRP